MPYAAGTKVRQCLPASCFWTLEGFQSQANRTGTVIEHHEQGFEHLTLVRWPKPCVIHEMFYRDEQLMVVD